MQICRYSTAEQACRAAAMIFASEIIRKPSCVLGLATGSSPIPMYQELIRLNQAGVVDFSSVTSFNLDEYVGIPEDHECSYHRFMRDQLFNHVNIRLDATHVPNGNAADLAAESANYDNMIVAAGGIDVQVLGIGRNGHIGFNEPDSFYTWGCHVVNLTESTIDANKRFFASEADVPRKAISMGIGGIMTARCVVLIATGADKAKAVRDAIYGEVNPQVQASILRTHPNVFFMLDEGAASLLDK